jgi:hypothetical protein
MLNNPGGMLNISRWCKPPVIGYKRVPSPGQGRRRSKPYVIDTFEPALSHHFWNKESPANDPIGMAILLEPVGAVLLLVAAIQIGYSTFQR